MASMWILMGHFGEYADATSSPQAAYTTQAAADAMCAKLSDIARRANADEHAWRYTESERFRTTFERYPPARLGPFVDEAEALGFGLAASYDVHEVDLVEG